MADLTALIRLHKHELDEKRLVLARLYTEMAHLERQRRDLERAFEQEKAAADNTADIHFTFARYVEQTNRRRKELEEQAAQIEKRITSAKDSMMETFGELKKYEMTQQERDRLAEEERLFKESGELDAVGIEGFRRKGEE
jgi:flagellar export protein FliJ